jgi:DNA-binding CsgD family transcriptional regulator
MAARSGVRRAAGEDSGDAGSGLLEGARRAAIDLRWLDVYEALSELDRRSALAVEDLELLATAAYLRGRGQECRHARLRAYQLYLHRGDVRRAARCAAQIGLEQLSAGEVAQAAGCLPVSLSACSAWAAQAEALAEHEQEGAGHGYHLIPVAYEQLAIEGNLARAADAAAQAVVTSRRFGDPDLLALALNVHGRAMVRSRRVPEGMMLLDESVALVVAGDVSPSVAGLVLTAAVDASDEAFELGRCDEWTRALARWCDRQEGMVPFRCRSLAHKAALERRHGRWGEALEVADRACEPPIAELDPTAAAAARYQQGEVLRLRGELKGAAAAYRQAGELALDPQPGMALLRLAEGDTAAASTSLDRALGEAQGGLDRARMLPARVEILLTAGQRSAAVEAAQELEQIARDHCTAALEAAARQASAAVLLTEGDPLAALTSARLACRVWRHFELPYEKAQARVLIARCCRMLGDEATAALELYAACEILARLGAKPDLDQTRIMLGRTTHASTHGLTRRELEVFELLATGLTNRAIAEQLQVTTRTVDTHVSSILTKLGVSTRAAATAFAHRHDLV